MITHPAFKFSKGRTADPAVIPTGVEPVVRSQIENHVYGPPPEACPAPPTKLSWWQQELSWVHDLTNNETVPATYPLQRAASATMSTQPGYGPYKLNRDTMRGWTTKFLNGPATYSSTTIARDKNHTWALPHSNEQMALLDHNDIGGQFFVERAVELYGAGTLRPGTGQFFSGNNLPGDQSLLDVMASIWTCHQEALRQCFSAKWYYMLARPEELVARINSSPDLMTKMGTQPTFRMRYPEGAPRHPAFPSGHAACAGAGAAILCSAIGTLSPDILALAELTFVGRATAGIHWACDGIAGLVLGWDLAVDMCPQSLIVNKAANPWRALTAGWYD